MSWGKQRADGLRCPTTARCHSTRGPWSIRSGADGLHARSIARAAMVLPAMACKRRCALARLSARAILTQNHMDRAVRETNGPPERRVAPAVEHDQAPRFASAVAF